MVLRLLVHNLRPGNWSLEMLTHALQPTAARPIVSLGVEFIFSNNNETINPLGSNLDLTCQGSPRQASLGQAIALFQTLHWCFPCGLSLEHLGSVDSLQGLLVRGSRPSLAP